LSRKSRIYFGLLVFTGNPSRSQEKLLRRPRHVPGLRRLLRLALRRPHGLGVVVVLPPVPRRHAIDVLSRGVFPCLMIDLRRRPAVGLRQILPREFQLHLGQVDIGIVVFARRLDFLFAGEEAVEDAPDLRR
jgi:hypothetical protein